MEDSYDLITVIKVIPRIATQLRWEGEYRYADILEVAEDKLKDYLQVVRATGKPDSNSERRENND